MLDRHAPGPHRAVLDIGPGVGTWRAYLNGHPACQGATWAAIEAWAPYVDRFGLRQMYDLVVVADASWVDLRLLGRQDLVIVGDVLEHFAFADGVALIRRLLEHTGWLLLSVPVGVWEQGAVDGNPFEAHLATWDDDLVRSTFQVSDGWVGAQIGVYLIRGARLP